MRIKLRAAAERDLDDIFDYSVERYGRDRAETYLRDLESATERLLAFPGLGAESVVREDLRVLGVREHHVFYRIEQRAIVVVRVLHKRMDASRHL